VKTRTTGLLPGMPDVLAKTPPKALSYAGMTLNQAITRSHQILDEVCEQWSPQFVVLLFSGGNDSTLLSHLLRERVHQVALADTRIRVPGTARYVQACAAAWGMELFQPHGQDTYRDLVCGRVLPRTGEGRPVWKGFPGPAGHYLMYQRLKERAFEGLRSQLVGKRGRAGQIVFLDGMRWGESERRWRNADEVDRKGAMVWCSPIVHWTDGHMSEYRERHRCRQAHNHAEHRLCEPGTLPVNEVTVHLHMSGDCLCGAFAQKGEIYGLELFYPDTAAELHDIEAEARSLGLDVPAERLTWGWGADRERPRRTGRLCSRCQAPEIDGQGELFS
jgi:3'-phosphoadenosine 5'-phosphosulfate sulfotransferase (PAPS reductase)/FAD synthetase